MAEEERPMLPQEASPVAADSARLRPGESPVATGPAELLQSGGEEEASNTREELAAKFELLVAHVRAAGMSPIRVMGETYIKRGMAVLDSLLSALEEAPKKPPEEKT